MFLQPRMPIASSNDEVCSLEVKQQSGMPCSARHAAFLCAAITRDIEHARIQRTSPAAAHCRERTIGTTAYAPD
jgi:hypothetical protein